MRTKVKNLIIVLIIAGLAWVSIRDYLKSTGEEKRELKRKIELLKR